jgi:hypothetical protein
MDNQTIQLAILGLEEQSRKINDAIRVLKAQLDGPAPRPPAASKPAGKPATSAASAKPAKPAKSRKRKLSQAQRDAISRRMSATWAARRKAKETAAKPKAASKGKSAA